MQPNDQPEINPVGEPPEPPTSGEMLAPTPPDVPVPPPDKGSGSWVEASFVVFLLLLGVAVIFFVIQWVQPGMLNLALRVLLMLLGGVLPVLIYTSFVRNRLPTLFVEYKQNLRRLGFPEYLELYQKKFEEIYGRNPEESASRQLLSLSESPVIVATLLSAFGWFIVFFPSSDPSTLIPNNSTLAYGFLGAYIFGLGALVRQYLRDDLQPRYYANLTLRFLTVFILSWLVGVVVDYLQPGTTKDLYLLVAFVIGLFPTVGLLIIQRIGAKILGMVFKGFYEPYPLNDLDGLNAFQEDRLMLEGIENLQNLATANIVDLMLRTRYPVEQIIDWIDQALLHLHVRKMVDAFQQSGYRTATDFLDAFNAPPEQGASLDDWRVRLAAVIFNQLDAETAKGLDQDRMLTLMDTTAAALVYDPNMFHVQYWRKHEYEALPEEVERMRTRADLKLMQGLPAEAIDAYAQVLEKMPSSHTTRLYRGMAYFQLHNYSKAIDEYETAIREGALQWENTKIAYVELGRAYRELGDYQKARQYYEKALQLDKNYIEAHLEMAFLQMSYLGEYEQAIEHLDVAIQTNFKLAEALANRGGVRYEMWKHSTAMAPAPAGAVSSASLLEQAQADLLEALHLNPEMSAAVINLALVYTDMQQISDALNTLDRLIQKMTPEEELSTADRENAYRAHLQRGNLYLNLVEPADYAAAVENYKAATRLAPFDAGAFYNLGVAYLRLGRTDPTKRSEALNEAMRMFREAIDLKPGHAPAHQELGDLQLFNKQYVDAEKSLTIALRLSRERDDRKGQALAHLSLGKLYRLLVGRDIDASRELQQAGKLADEQDDDLTYTDAIFELGLLALSTAMAAQPPDPNLFDQACGQLDTAEALYVALGRTRSALRADLELANARLRSGDPSAAKQSFTKAQALLQEVFDPANPEDAQTQAAIEAGLKSL